MKTDEEKEEEEEPKCVDSLELDLLPEVYQVEELHH